ncbi:unnamed protein product [Adineta steineri]|uniref:Glycosyl hydrolase family 32 C-terminal domain-containing protein n=1 Tax=Adineta steineri TaxID=433720 RepID=A0A814S123_9BILA|nr:unnamed protein product [Adineta steineri]
MYRHQNNSINNLSRTIIGKILILGIIIYLVKYVMSDHTNHNSISESNSLPEVIKEIPNTIITDHQHRPLIHFSPKKNWINDPNEIKYIGNKNQIEFDRSHSGNINFHNSFYPQFNMSLDKETLTTGILKLQIIVDRCSIELFINGGKYTMTALIFPKYQGYQIELSIDGEDILLNYLELMLFSM